MPPIIAQDFNTNPISFQNAERWTFLQHVHYQLEETRHRLLNATHRMDLKCTDSTLNSFVNPTLFYEAAVSGFHNILLGLPPTTLGETIALCVMSHVTSCCLYSTCNYIGLHPFSNFDLWRNAISNHDHRQTFDDLINAVCLEPCLDFLMDISQYDNDMSNGALDLFWNSDLPTINESMQLTTSTEAPDLPSLQGSPIVANLTHFLERCGELPLILSSRGATANNWHPIGISKPARSEAEHRIQRLYIQLLQDNGCFKDPIARGILSVVDRFIGLGYLHNTCEMRDYLLLVGKVRLPTRVAMVYE
jgi:hypothetical protein